MAVLRSRSHYGLLCVVLRDEAAHWRSMSASPTAATRRIDSKEAAMHQRMAKTNMYFRTQSKTLFEKSW